MHDGKPKISEQEILLAVISGDKKAFRCLVERHQSTAFRFAFRLSCNNHDAQDLCQEAFLRVWNFRVRLNADARFTTLLYTILSRLWIDQIRRNRRSGGVLQNIESVNEPSSGLEMSPETITINQDMAQRIRTLSENLSPKQKLVFVLRDIEDFNIQEVVRITGISAGAVKTNLSLARKKLRQQFTGRYS